MRSYIVSKDLKETVEIIKQTFVKASDKTIRDIRRVFDILDEEPITFALILYTRLLLHNRKKGIATALAQDMNKFIKIPNLYNKISSYVQQNLEVDIVRHNRTFERKSNGDFGLIFQIPKLSRNLIKSDRIGLLVQAKRNALRNKPWAEFGKLPTRKDYSAVGQFYCLGLYQFDETDKKLSDISYVPLHDTPETHMAFVETTNNILKNGGRQTKITPSEFYSLFLNGNIGTRDEKEINKYILGNAALPILELSVKFKDDGEGLKSFAKYCGAVRQQSKTTARIRVIT